MFNIDKISYHVGTRHAVPLLSNISAKIPQGAMVAIMGLNGAGKTTLLKVMSHYLKPTFGTVCINSSDSNHLTQKELAQNLAFVPQDFPTDFPFTVFDFIMMGRFAWQKGLFSNPRDHERVHQAIKRLFLDGFEQRIISTLSGGERQRVLLARALVQNTQAILLDEPVNHLDIKNKIAILNILKDENQKNKKTIVAVMHDFRDVQKYFDQVLFLKDGVLKFFGDVSDGFQAPRLYDVFEVEVPIS